jgi:uncharacterized protein (DUF1778 family)
LLATLNLLPLKDAQQTIIYMEKRTVSITVKMRQEDYALLTEAADHIWPKAELSRSSIVLGLAKIGAESVLPSQRRRHGEKKS